MANVPHRLTIDIPAPPAKVWEVIADAPRRPRWLDELKKVDAPSRPLAQSDRFTAISEVFGHRVDGASYVLDSEAAVELAEEIHLGVKLMSRWRIEPVGTGAVVDHTITLHLPQGPFSGLIGWVLSRYIRSLQKRSLDGLKRIVTEG